MDGPSAVAVHVTVLLWLISQLSPSSSAYELQDTIHTLKEENLHLQHRLENLTRAIRDLKHLLMDHSRASGQEYDPDYLHAWREWSQRGISGETHQMLEQALCLTELHNAAQPSFITPSILILSLLVSPILATAMTF